MKYPWMQFFTGDWLKDPALSLCAPATRGVWMDLLCAMHELDRAGELRGTHEQLARVARCRPAEVAHALTELQTTGAADVTERNGVVTVVNRRMMKEAKERNGSRLRMQKMRRDAVVRPPLRDISHKSEVRIEERETRAPESQLISRTEFDALCQIRGVPKDCAEWFWNTYDARNWTDATGQPIRKIEPLLLNTLSKWRQKQNENRSRNDPNRNAGTYNATQDVAALKSKVR